ncbi:MAG: acyl-CoA dehydrogenase [Cryomorphaceae bacterium]|nr:MAG: acyl-CoA dehydrogenase [Cryomorphaceae bacterium]|tara:strand:+ start:6065 stop:7867 length:1803 start_codon:yes stop_codon:yes gene_type:complete
MEIKLDNITRGGEFIIKETNSKDIFTPEDFSEEQLMMKQAVKDFIEKEVVPHRERFENKDYQLTEDTMKKAGDLGFLGIAVPQKYGGMGMGFVSTMLVCEAISGASGSLSTAFGAHTGIGTMPIVLYGNEEQNKKYVPKLASGEIFGSYCLTEPSAGSDANSGKTKAVISKDGSHYKITGQKMWISNAGFAKLFIVFARIEDDKNITGFIVPHEPNNGITLGQEEKKLGIHSSSTRQVFFNETKVPVENMLSKRGSGFKIAMNSLNVGRIKLAVACLDAQKRVTTNAIQYANERIQFKTKIIDFEAIKEKIANMTTDTYVGESACYRAAKNIEDRIKIRHENGNSFQESELKGVEEYVIECSILKVAVSEDMQNIADDGIQVFGGMGFSADTPMEGAWRDCRIGRIYEGTNEINRMLSVGMLIKKAMKGHIDFINPATAVSDELMGIPSFDVPDLTELFAQEKLILKNLKKVFLMLAGAGIKKFGDKLEEHQLMLMGVSDILIEIYMSESALLRTEKNCNRFGKENQSEQIAMTQLYLYKAVDIIQTKGKEVIISFSSGDEQKGLLMGLKRFTKYYEFPNIIGLKNQIAEKLKEENQYCF